VAARSDPLPDQLQSDLNFSRRGCCSVQRASSVDWTTTLIKQGTIINKWGYADFDQALREIQNLAGNPSTEPTKPATTDSLISAPAKKDSLMKK